MKLLISNLLISNLIHAQKSTVFRYLLPYNAVAGNIQGIYSRDIHIRATQCAGLLCVTCLRVCGPLFILSLWCV